jgi:feruloyl esterase
MEATRFPDDFDGIVAGAPANPRSLRGLWKLQLAKWLDGDPARGLSEESVSMLQDQVLSYCDQIDGVKDRLIDNPLACKFDYEDFLCETGDADKTCLTAPQIETVRRVMSPATLADGTTVYPGFPPGSEGGWASFVRSDSYQVDDNFQYVVYPDQEWDWRTFDIDEAMPAALEADRLESVLSADLSAYTNGGGKLLIYHGWSDPRVSALGSIEYHARVMQETQNAEDSVRMFLAPGMGHCRGGEAPNVFDAVSALDAWVEGGNAPTQILATQYQPSTNTVVRTRPLCAYPQVARYQGSGSLNEAENFTCVTP